VHFYTDDADLQFNGVGPGPYAAIVTQTFVGGVCNLRVLPPTRKAYGMGAVSHEADRPPLDSCFWTWPPGV
jgi:hypothetical protein